MGIEDLQRNFEGYLNTPLLWHNAEVYDLQQCALDDSIPLFFIGKVTDSLRLGKLVERFVSRQLAANATYDILAENVQIQDGKRTIGELDALLMMKDHPIHLEIIYKFYVYDLNKDNDELSHWIGPNRKDSLLQKLDKLKNKQLPLLYHPKTQSVIKELKINVEEVKQQVLFKAQLFLPFDYQKKVFFKLNPECVAGFYVKMDDLYQFKTSQFFIPEKINWLMAVDKKVNWLSFDAFTAEVTTWLDKEIAPLCWLKENDILRKFFVVWW